MSTYKENFERAKKYTLFSFTGSPQKEYDPFYMTKGDGIYVWDGEGKRYIDLGSQLVNINVGFNNRSVIEAVKNQVEELAYVAPKHSYEKRGELGELIINELAPKNMAKVLFTLGGSDANEFAIRFAKAYTGKEKILSK
ncbi:MAG: aminotransferase class III-fold pyridoxal phosphate-dependent enzyme, partial [Eubacterium sp.]|nr:aminotransferase class III-fold pyridoxal phosphate-dependent enzyme [Eubacterium sp.]